MKCFEAELKREHRYYMEKFEMIARNGIQTVYTILISINEDIDDNAEIIPWI